MEETGTVDFSALDAAMGELGVHEEAQNEERSEQIEAATNNTDTASEPEAPEAPKASPEGIDQADAKEVAEAPELTLRELAAIKKQQEIKARAERGLVEHRESKEQSGSVDVDALRASIREQVLAEMRDAAINDPASFYQESGANKVDIAKQLLRDENGIEVPEHLKENQHLYQTKRTVSALEQKIEGLQRQIEADKLAAEQERQLSSLKGTIDSWLDEIPEDMTYLRNMAKNDRSLAVQELMAEAIEATHIEGSEYLGLDDIARAYNKQIYQRAKLFGLIGEQTETAATTQKRPIPTSQLSPTNRTPVKLDHEKTEEEIFQEVVRELEQRGSTLG